MWSNHCDLIIFQGFQICSISNSTTMAAPTTIDKADTESATTMEAATVPSGKQIFITFQRKSNSQLID